MFLLTAECHVVWTHSQGRAMPMQGHEHSRAIYSVPGPCLPTVISWVWWPLVLGGLSHSWAGLHAVTAAGVASMLIASAWHHDAASYVKLDQSGTCDAGQEGL